MIQLIAITRCDGSLTLMHFMSHPAREATDANVNAEICKAGILDARCWRRIDAADLPVSREHRDHWRDNGAEVIVDVEGAYV